MSVSSCFPLEPVGKLVKDAETRDPRRAPNAVFQYVDIASVCNKTFRIISTKSLLGSEAPSRARKVIRESDVIFATTRPYLKSIAAVPHELDNQICSTGFCVLRPGDRITSEWLFYCVTSNGFVRQVTPLMRGANYPAVTDTDVRSAMIPVPPLDEQRRIVGRINECLSRVEEIEANDIQIGRETVAVFPSILNERFNELSTTSKVLPLESAAEIRGGQSLPKGTSINAGKSALLIKVGDMNIEGNERTILRSREFLRMDEAGRGLIRAGAVVFPKRGGAIATNKKRILGRPALLDPNLMAVIAKPDQIRDTFLYYWCQTLDLNQLSNGGVIPQLNRKDLASLPVPLPDLDAQDRLVAKLEECEAACAELRSHCLESQEERKLLRESILRKAFAGEL